jgi:hypothetical protein
VYSITFYALPKKAMVFMGKNAVLMDDSFYLGLAENCV